MPQYAELATTTNFSFLRGASHPDEMVLTAVALGLTGLGVADRNTLAGVVRAYSAAKEADFPVLTGTRLVTRSGFEVLCYPQDRDAYGRLCRLLTTGNRRAPKGECHLSMSDILDYGEGQIFIAMPPARLHGGFDLNVQRLAESFPQNSYVGLSLLYRGNDRKRLHEIERLAGKTGLPTVATNDVHYHVPERRPLQDVVTAIREGVTVREAGARLFANAERHIKSPKDMARLFTGREAALARTVEILERCRFSLAELRYEYPDEVQGRETTPQAELERLAWEGAEWRFPDGIPDKVRAVLTHELTLIRDLDYAPYFLTVHDIVNFAVSHDILCQGRGSAANSITCYCLGITAVDPIRLDLLFERFVSAERNEPPDIDVDFEHERREEVIQYIYEKYGRDRAGIAATVITYRAKSAIREVGKVMGLSEDVTGALSGTVWGWSSDGIDPEHIRQIGLDPDDPLLMKTILLAREIIGFPRHLSQHVGGFVMTRGPLCEVIPIANAAMADRTFVEWDKDDLDALGILKVDVLGLGMLSCIARSFELLDLYYDKCYDLAGIPEGDGRVYDMLCQAETIGVFQVESRAQMSMLPRLKPRTYYDLVVEVAIVRPGPIQGDMVHPYLRRRDGKEDVSYPSEELRAVLEKTLGVPLFQEQAMRIAIVAAGFTPSEADRLRRAMATFRKVGIIHEFGLRLVEGMVANGYDRDFAERCFKQIEGFGEYGFPESHAASFALLVYVSAWLKCHYPDVFCCAILNSQPMGFYAPAQLVRDARNHGVDVRAVDVNDSHWDSTLEPLDLQHGADVHLPPSSHGGNACAVRLGFRQIKGMNEEIADRIAETRDRLGRRFDSIRDLWIHSGLDKSTLERLANADAFRSLGLDRRAALWAVRALGGDTLPLFNCAASEGREAEVQLPAMPPGEHVVHDYASLRLSLKAHPVEFLRDRLTSRGCIPMIDLKHSETGRKVALAGLVLVRQRPGSAKGVIFATLEDETGNANIIVWPKVFEQYRRVILSARLLLVHGKVQREGIVIHVVAEELTDLSGELMLLSNNPDQMGDLLAHADEVKRAVEDPREIAFTKRQMATARAARILPRSRDFH